MAFILPANDRDFGTQLAKTLSQAGADIGQGFVERGRNRKDQEILNSINETSSPIDIVKAHARLSANGQKTAGTLLDTYIKMQTQPNKEQLQINKENRAKEAKIAEEEESNQKEFDTGKLIIDQLESLKKYAGSTSIPFTASYEGGTTKGLFGGEAEGINRKAVEKRAEIDVLGQDMERVIRELTTKGQLSGTVYQNLQKYVPKADDSERKYQGKINGFKKLLEAKTKKQFEEREPAKEGHVSIVSPSGQIVQIPKDQVKQALSSGGSIP